MKCDHSRYDLLQAKISAYRETLAALKESADYLQKKVSVLLQEFHRSVRWPVC